jgi:hypothetical protein
MFVWLWLAIILVFAFLQDRREDRYAELTYSQFLAVLENQYIDSVVLRGQKITGMLTEEGREALDLEEPGSFETVRPQEMGEAVVTALQRAQVDIEVEPANAAVWQQILRTRSATTSKRATCATRSQ